MNQPPPLPLARSKRSRRDKWLIVLGFLGAMPVVLMLLLRMFNLLMPFRVPTGAMSPAVRAGDHIFMEGLSYRFGGKIERGDIIVFKTGAIAELTRTMPPTVFLKRAAGLPGERVRIEGGKLHVNDQPAILKNEAGEIRHANMATFANPATMLTVPEGHYFVLGDATTNSFDSRYWGFVPQEAVKGRVFFCYWPPSHFGRVK